MRLPTHESLTPGGRQGGRDAADLATTRPLRVARNHSRAKMLPSVSANT
jgi:hypothetical protein